MKLPKVMVHVRLGKRIFDHMQTIQLYKSKTATAIIEDALEKGLAWYLKQAGAEMGYTKEKPLTWEGLAALVKLSVSPKKDDKPEQDQREQSQADNYKVEYALYEIYKEEYADFEDYLMHRVEKKELTLDEAEDILEKHAKRS